MNKVKKHRQTFLGLKVCCRNIVGLTISNGTRTFQYENIVFSYYIKLKTTFGKSSAFRLSFLIKNDTLPG